MPQAFHAVTFIEAALSRNAGGVPPGYTECESAGLEFNYCLGDGRKLRTAGGNQGCSTGVPSVDPSIVIILWVGSCRGSTIGAIWLNCHLTSLALKPAMNL